MKWIVTITYHGYPGTVYDFNAPDEEAAKEKAAKCFRRYCDDTAREFSRVEDLPIVLLYEVPKDGIWIDLVDDWKAEKEALEYRRKRYAEESDIREYERLQKKFGKK